MKTIVIAGSILILIALAGALYYTKEEQKNDTQIVSASSTISFPSGGEELRQGETYTLSWRGGAEVVALFLIDRSLKDTGASVSISDRVYDIENIHMYNYTVPDTIKPGEYEFQIGDATSKPFTIVAK